jgi:serine/threonine-protein kinase
VSAKPSFFAELQRRHVYKVGAMYAVAGWLLVQVITQVFPIYDISAHVQRVFVGVIIAGFPVALVLAWLFDLTPMGIVRTEALPADGEASSARHERRSTDRKLNYVLAALLVVGIAYFIAERTMLRPAIAGAAQFSDKSIAVLPLANESGDKEQQYFSDGLSEDLINALSQSSGLKVIARGSSFRFRDSQDDVRTIGAKLGVAHLLEGSVRRAGDMVRISAELVDVADGSTLWSQHYDRPYADLFKLQDDITAAVAAALKTKLITGDSDAVAQSDRPPSGNLDAYKALLQGRFYAKRGTVQDFRKAIDYYKTALMLDPDYPLAHADLAFAQAAYATRYPVSETGPVDAIIASARASADTALRLQPMLAAAHAVHGFILTNLDLNFVASAAETARAVALDPQNAPNLSAQASSQLTLGEFDASLASARRAIALDPLNAGAYAVLSSGLAALGRYDEAESAARRGIELQPTGSFRHVRLAQIQVMRGDRAALASAQAETDTFWRIYALAFAQVRVGDRAAGDKALQTLIDCCSGNGSFQIASVYAARRDADKTFEWLERARTTRDAGLLLLYTDPFIHELRNDPRFAAFAAKIGLPPLTAAAAAR